MDFFPYSAKLDKNRIGALGSDKGIWFSYHCMCKRRTKTTSLYCLLRQMVCFESTDITHLFKYLIAIKGKIKNEIKDKQLYLKKKEEACNKM